MILLGSVFCSIVKSNRFFLLRLIEDMQEISLLVLLNLHYPAQLDSLLTLLYKFNFTSVVKIFEAIDKSNFTFGDQEIMSSG